MYAVAVLGERERFLLHLFPPRKELVRHRQAVNRMKIPDLRPRLFGASRCRDVFHVPETAPKAPSFAAELRPTPPLRSGETIGCRLGRAATSRESATDLSAKRWLPVLTEVYRSAGGRPGLLGRPQERSQSTVSPH